MNIKKMFSGLTLFGIFIFGAILLIGKTSADSFVLVFMPFMLLISFLFFIIVKDFLKYKSDKIVFGICLIFLSIIFIFMAVGFKDYADVIQKNEPIIKAQVLENSELMNVIDQKIEYANSLNSQIKSLQDSSNQALQVKETTSQEVETKDSRVLRDSSNHVFYSWEDDDREDDD